MNDDDLTQLASAYLDDEATADERARVEGSAQLTEAVDRLRAVRLALRDVEPPSISTRESHLAAALGAWDRIPNAERSGLLRDATPRGVDAAAAAGAATVSAPARLNDRRRTPSPKWLSAAAAAIVLIFAGGVALQLNSSSDDDSSSADDATALSADSDETASAELADGGDAQDDAAGSATEATSDPALESADPLAIEELESDAAEDGGEINTDIDNAAPPPDADLILLLTPDDLALFAASAMDAPQAPDVPAATSAPIDPDDLTDEQRTLVDATVPKCLGVDIIVGPAVYVDVSVFVGIDESRDLAIAYAIADCDEIARAKLP